MGSRDIPLHMASVEQLVEELGRKLNAQHKDMADPPEQWCDECKHFRFLLPGEDFRRERSPCMKKHPMDFYVPQPHDSPETFGYFRLVCPDREERPPPLEPAPPKPKPPVPRAPPGSRPKKVK